MPVDQGDGEILGWTWSPDGEYLATVGPSRPPRESSAGVSLATLVLWTTDGREFKRLPLDVHAAINSRLSWHPNGSLVIRARDDKGQGGFHRVDLESGTHETLQVAETTELGKNHRGLLDLSRDGGTLYFARARGVLAREYTIVAHDIATGGERGIAPTVDAGVVALSPDGSTIAYVGEDENDGNRRGLYLAAVAGGSPRELFRYPEGSVPGPFNNLNWTPDGRHVVWPLHSELWAVSLDGDVRRTPFIDLRSSGIRIHPDGRRVVFMAGASRGEIWAMDGLGDATTSGDGSQ